MRSKPNGTTRAGTGEALPLPLREGVSWWRSPWFWFGWPGLIGLLWGWLAFTNDTYEVSWVTKKGSSLGLGGGDGEFYFERRQLQGDAREEAEEGLNWAWRPDHYEDQGCVFMRKPYAIFSGDEGAGAWEGTAVAAWAALLAYLGVWGGLLAWRSRCLRKKMTGSEEP